MAETAKVKSIDPASLQMIEKALCDEVSLSFDRAQTITPCPIGVAGCCCTVCAMGPCRVPLPKGKTAETP
jgi:carbon-monoxide dehydrogenase catalytic subunit